MLIIQREKSAEHLGRLLPVSQLDDAAIAHAREIFAGYSERGVILGSSFDDPEWKMSNETATVTFALPPLTKETNWIGISQQQYTYCIKAYIVLKLGDLALSTLQNLARTLASLIVNTSDYAAGLTHDITHITDLLSLLPSDSLERDWVAETLEERVRAYRHNSGVNSQRVLAAFNSYLRFNEILADYWQTASDKMKLFYFPVYLWWNLTAVLPLRPTEFLLTPRNCLDRNVLTIRRTKLKGSGGRVNYRVAQDYMLNQYEISSALAAEINSYLALTEHMPGTELDTLLRLEPHYNRLRMGPGKRNRYYTYNLCIHA